MSRQRTRRLPGDETVCSGCQSDSHANTPPSGKISPVHFARLRWEGAGKALLQLVERIRRRIARKLNRSGENRLLLRGRS
jgi:hypothetical protein